MEFVLDTVFNLSNIKYNKGHSIYTRKPLKGEIVGQDVAKPCFPRKPLKVSTPLKAVECSLNNLEGRLKNSISYFSRY